MAICAWGIPNRFTPAPRPCAWWARQFIASLGVPAVATDRFGTDNLPRTLPGFEAVRRYRNSQGQLIAKLLPGDFYVTCEDEVLDTVLGSCVSACIRSTRLRI